MKSETDYHYRWYTRIMRSYRFSSPAIPLINPLIRSMLKSFYITHKSYLTLLYRSHTKEEIENCLASRIIFFGFAVSRSGTSFLSTFLNNESPHALILHEANVLDFSHFQSALSSRKKAIDYIAGYRIYDIYRRVSSHDSSVYGEISPHLRQHCEALKLSIPNALFFHLVRDGKDVVSSLIARGRLSRKDPLLVNLKPPIDDPYAEKWVNMSVFEKVCWLWQHDNRFLRLKTERTVHFEELLSDYSYFRSSLLDYLNLDIDEATWKRYVIRPVNVTPAHKRSAWMDWSSQEKTAFLEICSEEMKESGYNPAF